MKQRLLFILIASLLAQFSFAQDPYPEPGTTFKRGGLTLVWDGPGVGLSVVECDEDVSGDVSIPSSMIYSFKGEATEDGYKTTEVTLYVTAIQCSFRKCTGITSLTIPSRVTWIEWDLPPSLQALHIPSIKWWCNIYDMSGHGYLYQSNRPIIPHVYVNNEEVKDLNIPNSIKEIRDGAFMGWTGLTSVNFHSSVSTIGAGAFAGCTGLTGNLTIPNSVTTIRDGAFYECIGLTGKLTIPNSVTDIGYHPFAGCRFNSANLNMRTIPPLFDEDIFASNSTISEITLGNSVNSIEGEAFAGFNNLTSITIPNSVTTIGGRAFSYCKNLTSITIGNGVTSIGYDAFEECENLVRVYITDIAKWCGINFNDGRANPLWIATRLYVNNKLLTNLEIPKGVTDIGSYAFYNYKRLANLSIPNSVTSIGSCAFYNCTGLTGTLNIPKSVKEIGYQAFNGTGYTDINIEDIAAWCKIKFGSYYSPLNGRRLLLNGEVIGNLVIPDDVTAISNNSFSGCTNLTGTLTIPNSVTNIGTSAFSGCGFTGELNIPSSVNTIGYAAFKNCKDFTGNLIIPNSVTSIGSEAFSNCKGLTGTINISSSVTDIGNYAFSGCSGLTGTLSIPNTITYIRPGTFTNCSGLEAVNIPNSVIRIETDAFTNCSGMKALTIGTQVDKIEDAAFYNCKGLREIYSLCEIPPVLGTNVFGQDTYSTQKLKEEGGCVLYVPFGSLEDYADEWDWPESQIVEMDLTGIKELQSIDKQATPIAYYNLQGQRISQPQKGIVIVRYSDGTSRKMLVK